MAEKSIAASKDLGSLSEAEADQMWEHFRSTPAPLTHQQVSEHEGDCQQRDMLRRAAFALLTKSGAELIATIEKERKTAVAMARLADSLKAYRQHLEGLKEVIEQAEVRISIALCGREDMVDIFREAELHREATNA